MFHEKYRVEKMEDDLQSESLTESDDNIQLVAVISV